MHSSLARGWSKLWLQKPKLVGITSSINAKRGTHASQDVSVPNEPFACGSSSTAVRQALDKALDKTHQEQHKQLASIPLNGQPFRWVNDDEAAFDRGAASESRGPVAPPLVVQ